MSRTMPGTIDCTTADELGAAYALGAVERDEHASLEAHLASCDRPHQELRSLIGASDLLAASLEPAVPSSGLRDRLMTTIATTPQDRAAAPAAAPAAVPVARIPTARSSRFSWLSPGFARGLAAVVVVAVAFGAWNFSLQGQLSSRDQVLRAVAAAIAGGDAAFRVTGSAGAGYVVANRDGTASLVVADLAPLDANRIYELWLIGADKVPVAVGAFGGSHGPVAVVGLERGLAGFVTFAVTVEAQRVAAPTSQPVMVASLATQ
jgi:anti-sigma-K factor RskA